MNRWTRIFLPFAAGYYLSYLLRNTNAVIAPELTRELSLSAADLGLLTSVYLLAFGAFQLPLGILLDRYGARRVEAGLLLVAAAGSALFGLGRGLAGLVLARAAIGLGVSACLMASFKSFSAWFPVERLPSLNSAVMVAGALGALTATTPLSLAVPLLGWRGLFLALAGVAVAASAAVFSTPEPPAAAAGETLGRQLEALAGVVASPVFWRYAPQASAVVGGFMALQGLWAVPWLMVVEGHSRGAAAFHVLLTTAGMFSGFLAIALLVGPMRRAGVGPQRVLALGMAVGLLAMLALLLGAGGPVPWFALGLQFAAGNLAYALLAGHFPASLAGRANTALNLCSFVGAFAIQWGYGVLLDALAARGWLPAAAHRAALGSLLALQAAGFGWYLLAGDRAGQAPVAGKA